jgi:hypothetical protein
MNVVETVTLDPSRERIHAAIDDPTYYRERLREYLGQNGQTLTPVQRINCDFGWRVLNNATWEQGIWTAGDELKRFVKEVIGTLEYTINSQTQVDTLASLKKIGAFLNERSRRHIAAIRALLVLEDVSGSRETTRRYNLLIVSRGRSLNCVLSTIETIWLNAIRSLFPCLRSMQCLLI